MNENTSPKFPEPLNNGHENNTPPKQSHDNPENDMPLPDSQGQRGSLWAGFGLFWVIFLGNFLVFPIVGSLNISSGNSGSSVLGAFLLGYQLLPLALCIWLAIRGRWRTVLGIVLGYVSALALALLLVSICVGLFSH